MLDIGNNVEAGFGDELKGKLTTDLTSPENSEWVHNFAPVLQELMRPELSIAQGINSLYSYTPEDELVLDNCDKDLQVMLQVRWKDHLNRFRQPNQRIDITYKSMIHPSNEITNISTPEQLQNGEYRCQDILVEGVSLPIVIDINKDAAQALPKPNLLSDSDML